MFQLAIVGIGHLVAEEGYNTIVELRKTTLITGQVDVFFQGHIHEMLLPTIEDGVGRIVSTLESEGIAANREYWDSWFEYKFLATICRLLNRMQGFAHGGAILLTPDDSLNHLRIKYKLNYTRLKAAMESHFASSIQKSDASDYIYDLMETRSVELMPIMLHLDEAVASNDKEDSEDEIDGTIWFISLLSRVDGLVLMKPDLSVLGFGVEITCPEPPSKVYLAQDAVPTTSRLHELDYERYGTRHRSMMRYCDAIPGSVGFVVSQDGAVRVVTSLHGKLIMWDNIKLTHKEFVTDSMLRVKETRREKKIRS